MTTVAANIVATMMGSSFSTAATSEPVKGNDDFQKVLEKSHTNITKSTEAVAIGNDKSTKVSAKPEQATENSNKPVDKETVEKLQKIMTKLRVIKNDANKSPEETIDDLTAAISDIITQLAEALNMTEDDLMVLIDQLDLTIADLFDSAGLQTLVMGALGIEEPAELLTNTQFNEIFKSIQSIVDSTVEKYQIDTTNLKEHESLLETIKTELVSKEVVQEETTETTKPETVITAEVKPEQQAVKTTGNSGNTENAVEVKTDSQSSTSQSGKNSQSSDFMNTFTSTLENVVTEKVTTIQVGGFEQVMYTKVNGLDILQQIVTQMKVSSLNNVQTLSFQLQPENLGKIAFSVSNNNGILTGSFVAENNVVKEAIEMNLTNLKSTLVEQGIKVDEIKVVVGNTSDFFNQQEKQQFQHQHAKKQKKILDISAFNLEEMSEEKLQDVIRYSTDQDSHSVEFSA